VHGLENKKIQGPLEEKLAIPKAERIYAIKAAFEQGMSVEQVHEATHIDPWFLDNIQQIVEFEGELRRHAKSAEDGRSIVGLDPAAAAPLQEEELKALIRKAKEYGFSDLQLAAIFQTDELAVREFRKKHGITPTYQLVDTCAAEFEAYTPYYYSTYETQTEVQKSQKPTIMILGGGPNRIGQGIEFDYCCCHASFALKEIGYQTIMVNSNPETVSTDYDTSDRLYFEPVTFEDVMNIIDVEKPEGVIVQFGGQTPLNLAKQLHEAGVPIIGTSSEAIHRAEDRAQFKKLIDKLSLKQPPCGTGHKLEEIRQLAADVVYPVILRPSFVLGGRAMEIVYDEEALVDYIGRSAELISPDRPILVDHFLEEATEVDVDMIADGEDFVVGGVMEHIEEAGVHSGDSACCLPPYTLSQTIVDEIKRQTALLAKELGVVGLMNVQFAVKGETIFILEVNPRASRTVPFASKAIGQPLAKLAAKCMAGKKLKELGFTRAITPPYFCVKEAVLPFVKFHGVDITLGPEMKSTGEVMGIDHSFGGAYAKSQMGASSALPVKGTIFLSVRDEDKKNNYSCSQKACGLAI